MPAHAIVVLARAPRLGTVKTRLAQALGDARALEIYRALAEHTLQVARASRLAVHVAYTPADAGDEMRRWLGDGIGYEPQCDGDLGARMAHAMERRNLADAGRVVVVGTDCPDISGALIHAAVAALDRADVVIGPAADGGYYLVAMRDLHRTIFDDIPWSSDRTLAVTLERARRAGLAVALLPELRDVDTADDWAAHAAGGK